MKYSDEFQGLIKDKQRVQHLLRGSFFHNASFEFWFHSRRFIADLIDHSGTIFDLGCGNGFLLRCLQEWSAHKLVPYGVDINAPLIEEARDLFPAQANHFFEFDALKLPQMDKLLDLPPNYDFVFWAVWDNWKFERQQEIDMVRALETMVKSGGKLILAFYHESRDESFRILRKIENLGFVFSGTIENFDGCELLAWQDRPATDSPA
jgi:SAM-dependent methyltransferase